MTGVFVAADQTDKKMWKAFPDILRRQFRTRCFPNIQDPLPDHLPDNLELAVCHMRHAAALDTARSVYIFKETGPYQNMKPDAENVVAVVDAGGGRGLLELVSATGLPAVTCGLSARDTITLSSMDSDSAVLTLQRSITCFDGSVAEPQEFPVKLRETTDSFTLMAAATVFLLTGNAERLKHAEF